MAKKAGILGCMAGSAPGRWSEPTALIPTLKGGQHPSENDLINLSCFQANSSHLSELFRWGKYLVVMVIN